MVRGILEKRLGRGRCRVACVTLSLLLCELRKLTVGSILGSRTHPPEKESRLPACRPSSTLVCIWLHQCSRQSKITAFLAGAFNGSVQWLRLVVDISLNMEKLQWKNENSL